MNLKQENGEDPVTASNLWGVVGYHREPISDLAYRDAAIHMTSDKIRHVKFTIHRDCSLFVAEEQILTGNAKQSTVQPSEAGGERQASAVW